MVEDNVERKKAKSKGFAVLGVPVGSILTFRKDPAITCKTVDDKNKVEYLGKVYPISGLAKELMKTPISGYHAFKFNDVLLAKLDDSGKSPKEPQTPVTKPAEAAPVAPTATPQTIPLPKPAEAPVKAREGNVEETSIDPLAGFPPIEETET
jgi:hypothetical protein